MEKEKRDKEIKKLYETFWSRDENDAISELKKEFKYKGVVISRDDYRNAPCPLMTEILSDEDMIYILHRLVDSMGSPMYNETFWEREDTWVEYELILCRKFNVPYFEDYEFSDDYKTLIL